MEIAPWRIHLKEGEHFVVSLTGGKSVEAITIKIEIVKPHVSNRRYLRQLRELALFYFLLFA